MDFRHEWKHEISYSDLLALRARLPAVMAEDPHADNGKYEVRSLYFDNLGDKALREKTDGVNCREKFRLRYYNWDISFILLEKKSKVNGLCKKVQEQLSLEEAQAAADGDACILAGSSGTLARELSYKMNLQGLRPRTIVDYTREPFAYAPGNVRVTLDYNIHTGMVCTDFLDQGCIMVPAGGVSVILEVKWDSFLPSLIRDIVQVPNTHTSSFSKYAVCRIYG